MPGGAGLPVLLCLGLFLGFLLPPLQPSAQAGERLQRIFTTQVLRVGTPGDYLPFAKKTETGYEGHDIDLIERIGAELGVRIDYVETSWQSLQEDAQADRFDVGIGGITRNVARVSAFEMLPGYAPFGKVALIRASDSERFGSLGQMNQPQVRVITTPGGSNERFVRENLPAVDISTHMNDAESALQIARGEGDIMISETFSVRRLARTEPDLYAGLAEQPLTPLNWIGFLLPVGDDDYLRVMRFTWDQLERRGELDEVARRWLE